MTWDGRAENYLYSSGRSRCDPRFCRTHALLADLFAKSSFSPFNAEAWTFNARAWAGLAEIKEREETGSNFGHPAAGL